jgi:hypothetical protein
MKGPAAWITMPGGRPFTPLTRALLRTGFSSGFDQVSDCHKYARPTTEISQPVAIIKKTGCECLTVDASISTTSPIG